MGGLLEKCLCSHNIYFCSLTLPTMGLDKLFLYFFLPSHSKESESLTTRSIMEVHPRTQLHVSIARACYCVVSLLSMSKSEKFFSCVPPNTIMFFFFFLPNSLLTLDVSIPCPYTPVHTPP